MVTVHGAELGLEDFSVRYDEQKKELLISAQEESSSVSIDLAAPIRSSERPAVKPGSMITLWFHANLFLVRFVHHHSGKGQCGGEEDGV